MEPGHIQEMEYDEAEKEVPLLLRKKIDCPICERQFTGLTVKSGKVRRIGTDMDLRPINNPMDPIKYGVYSCPFCGYSALAKNFDMLTGAHKKLIREKVAPNYVQKDMEEPDAFSYDDAITVHKLAIISNAAKLGRDSERAYLYLLLGWLCRGKAQMIERFEKQAAEENGEPEPAAAVNAIGEGATEPQAVSCYKQSFDYLAKAREIFMLAEAKETPPFCGLDIPTTEYLIGALAYETGKYDLAMQMCSRTLIGKAVSRQLKDRAYDLKNLLKEKKAQMNEEQAE